MIITKYESIWSNHIAPSSTENCLLLLDIFIDLADAIVLTDWTACVTLKMSEPKLSYM